MNLTPVVGDTWTKPGESGFLEVISVDKTTVRMRRDDYEFTIPLTEYPDLAAATVRNGGRLERTETEDFIFE